MSGEVETMMLAFLREAFWLMPPTMTVEGRQYDPNRPAGDAEWFAIERVGGSDTDVLVRLRLTEPHRCGRPTALDGPVYRVTVSAERLGGAVS